MSVGSYECANFVKKCGGLEAKELINKSASKIAKFWRQNKKKTTHKPIREYRKGSIMRRLSHATLPTPIIEVMHDSVDFSELESEASDAAESIKLIPPAYLNKRHSGMGSFSRRRSSFLEANIFNDDVISAKISAATKIQKAWKRFCIKVETKFLIQLMGPEEASLIIERLIIKEREKEMKKYTQEISRRKSRRASDASKLLYEFPSKTSVDSRRSSFSFGRAETNGLIPITSSDESSDFGGIRRRSSVTAGFRDNRRRSSVTERKNSKPRHNNPSITMNTESESSSDIDSFLSPNSLGNSLSLGKPLSRTPTVYKITMSDDELAYFAMERERNEQENS